MAVFRIEKNSDFTIMPNYPFRDMRLSFKGRGLLGTMLTLRDTGFPPNDACFPEQGNALCCKALPKNMHYQR